MDQTDPKQKKAEELAKKAITNVMARIANVLTDEDLKEYSNDESFVNQVREK